MAELFRIRSLSFTGANATSVFGITNDRAQLAANCTHADLVTSGSTQSKLNNYFNSSCILRNAAGAAIWPVIGDDGRATNFGNGGVGAAFGPGQNNTDIAITKRTPLRFIPVPGIAPSRAGGAFRPGERPLGRAVHPRALGLTGRRA